MTLTDSTGYSEGSTLKITTPSGARLEMVFYHRRPWRGPSDTKTIIRYREGERAAAEEAAEIHRRYGIEENELELVKG